MEYLDVFHGKNCLPVRYTVGRRINSYGRYNNEKQHMQLIYTLELYVATVAKTTGLGDCSHVLK